MKGTVVFTDKTHSRVKSEIFESPYVPGAKKLEVSKNGTSGVYGFGVAITPSSCYELSLMDPDDRTRLLKSIYSKDGLGLNVARLCIGSSDYSPELYSYDDVENDTELKHFSIERDMAYIIPIIKEIVEINPALYLFASPWSPPFWMKTGGSMCGGYMRREYIDCYAEYIVKFIKAYAKEGIHISAITPQNEPETQQNYKMPACVWHPEIEAEFICVLKNKFDKNGLDIRIWMHDHNFGGTDRVIWSLENCNNLVQNCDGVAFHYYYGTIEQTMAITRKFPKLELHFTEGGPRLTDNYDTDWCKWGVIACKALGAGYRSFTGWNLMLDERGGPNIGPFLGQCGGFVTRDSVSGELSYSGQYKAFSHIAPYITPESVIYPVSMSDSFGMQVGSYPKTEREIVGVVIEQPDNKKTAVLVNPNNSGVQAQLEIDNKLWYIELQADSISTIEW